MQQGTHLQPSPLVIDRGELFSILLRLHPIEEGWVSPSSGSQAHAAFLDIVHQNDPTLAEQLHQPNQRRPFTVGLLQGFNHLSATQLEEVITKNQKVQVLPGQVYWLRITMLDSRVFGMFIQHLITKPRTFIIRLGEARFEVSRLIGSPDPNNASNPWATYSSFAELRKLATAQRYYEFEFATPTAFSMGQQHWGKLMKLLPEPAFVFESLAKQWETFAPEHLRMASNDLTARQLAAWCEENLIVTRYTLETRYLPSGKFAQAGFQGKIMYEMKGTPTSPEAAWLTPLAHFALFSGVGYKTSVGMGQTRCTNLVGAQATNDRLEMEVTS
jgi:CRISPR-associated endoribonuclease Cas6